MIKCTKCTKNLPIFTTRNPCSPADGVSIVTCLLNIPFKKASHRSHCSQLFRTLISFPFNCRTVRTYTKRKMANETIDCGVEKILKREIYQGDVKKIS